MADLRTSGKKNIATRRNVAVVFDWLGGAQALEAWARENPGEFYTKIWAKLITQKISGKVSHTIKRDVKQFTDAELQAIVAGECERIATETRGEEIAL